MTETAAGCPIRYRYPSSVFRGAASLSADTVYVVGGLYGNIEALHEILRMQAAEQRDGNPVALVFNGDHNWFNTDANSFQEINATVLDHVAIQGNVEAEIGVLGGGDCGCGYPSYVNAAFVERSNAIMAKLQAVAADFPTLTRRLGELPMTRTIEVGDRRIGIVHGDADTLSGWGFAAERLSPVARCGSGKVGDGGRGGDVASVELTPASTIERMFRDAGVCAFASTHTCLPHARDYIVDGIDRLIINNGAAGMANFANSTFGVITRISAQPKMPHSSLYGVNLGGLRFDAVPVHFDHAAWKEKFLINWTPGSPAYESYFERIVDGPDFAPVDAVAGRVRLS